MVRLDAMLTRRPSKEEKGVVRRQRKFRGTSKVLHWPIRGVLPLKAAKPCPQAWLMLKCAGVRLSIRNLNLNCKKWATVSWMEWEIGARRSAGATFIKRPHPPPWVPTAAAPSACLTTNTTPRNRWRRKWRGLIATKIRRRWWVINSFSKKAWSLIAMLYKVIKIIMKTTIIMICARNSTYSLTPWWKKSRILAPPMKQINNRISNKIHSAEMTVNRAIKPRRFSRRKGGLRSWNLKRMRPMRVSRGLPR